MAVEDKIFIPYIERKVSKPFSNLKPDEQIIAHWALVYKELIKFNYSSLIGCDLDSPMTEKQMKGLSSDKKGGIMWYNYMYSDAYKEDEKLKKDKIEVGGKDPNYWARLSIFEALERFSLIGLGDFKLSPRILSYLKEMRENPRGIPNSHIIRDTKRYEAAKEAAEAILRIKPWMAGQIIISMVGMFSGECAWNFKGTVMEAEASGNTTSKFASGAANAGECWFGLTNWAQKIKCINACNLTQICHDPGSYNPKTNGLSSPLMSLNDHAKITAYYYTDYGGWPAEFIKSFEHKKPSSMQDMDNIIACAFLQKAGAGSKPSDGDYWPQALKREEPYWNWHDAKGNGVNYNNLACSIYHAAMFARFLKDKTVPKGDPWET